MPGSGIKNSQWKGGTFIRDSGYRMVLTHGHPRATSSGYVREHILVAERAFGGPLPDHAVLHHVDSNRANNENSNLVICEDQSFHRLLHTRADALKACGHPDWLRCRYCKQYDDPKNLQVHVMKKTGFIKAKHSSCSALQQRMDYAKKKAQRLLNYGQP